MNVDATSSKSQQQKKITKAEAAPIAPAEVKPDVQAEQPSAVESKNNIINPDPNPTDLNVPVSAEAKQNEIVVENDLKSSDNRKDTRSSNNWQNYQHQSSGDSQVSDRNGRSFAGKDQRSGNSSRYENYNKQRSFQHQDSSEDTSRHTSRPDRSPRSHQNSARPKIDFKAQKIEEETKLNERFKG